MAVESIAGNTMEECDCWYWWDVQEVIAIVEDRALLSSSLINLVSSEYMDPKERLIGIDVDAVSEDDWAVLLVLVVDGGS